jgi:hypothetical protein
MVVRAKVPADIFPIKTKTYMLKKNLFRKALALSILTGTAMISQAATIVLDFEGVGDLQPVGNFYNGGGPNDYDIDFVGGTLGLIDSDIGGSGNIGNEPSPSTVMFFLQATAIMNVNNGFTDGFSFFYSSTSESGSVKVYDGLNGTGTLLATLTLTPLGVGPGDPTGAYSNWAPVGVTFAGTAYSVDFGGTANYIIYDDITIGSEIAGGEPVPEPSTVIGGLALGALALRRALRRK